LYEIVRDNLETLYGAIEDGAIVVRIPEHARKELEGPTSVAPVGGPLASGSVDPKAE
jgi:hypothetical protein